MNRLDRKIRELQKDGGFQYFIFNLSELEPKEAERDEKWGWTFYSPSTSMLRRARREGYEIIRNVRTEGHPSTHRREIRVASSENSRASRDTSTWEWVEDKKRKLSPETTSQYFVTDTLKIKVKTKNHCSLSSSLQDNIIESLSNYLFQGRRRPRESFRNKFQSVMFVDINTYDNLKEWIIFDKQWLYEEIRRSHLPNCFILSGLCANFQTKTDAELKQWLQQKGYLPADTDSRQENNHQSNNNHHIDCVWAGYLFGS